MTQDLYTPSRWGEVFHTLDLEEALGAGAAGPGKTLVLLMDPLPQIMLEHERCRDPDHPYKMFWGQSTGWALHLRRTLRMLEQTIARSHRIFPGIDPGAKYDSQKTTWRFTSGYHYQFGHCKDPNSWEDYFSNEYTHIGFDELVQFEEEQYDQISTRCRSSDPILRKMLKVRAMSNPLMRRDASDSFSVRNPQWVRQRFVDPAPEGRVILKRRLERADGTIEWRRWIYLPATLYDNPNKEFVRDYEATLLNAKPHIRQALLYGNWYITAGSFYAEEWNARLHICDPFNIPDDWPRFRSMDWGYKRPGCVHWWAMDEDDNLYCEREYTFQGKTATEVAKRIREIERDARLWKSGRSLITGPADTQLWEQRGESAMSKADEFARVGVGWISADKRSRQRNAERVLERLKDHQAGSTTPGLVFFRNCRQAIKTLPAIQADPTDPECPQDGGDDHWHDSICYASAYASHGRRGIGRAERSDEDDDVSNRRVGRYGYGQEVC